MSTVSWIAPTDAALPPYHEYHGRTMDRLLRASLIPLGLLTVGSLCWYTIHSRRDSVADAYGVSASAGSGVDETQPSHRYPPKRLDLPKEIAPIAFAFGPEGAGDASDLASYRSFTESTDSGVPSPAEARRRDNVRPLPPTDGVVRVVTPVRSRSESPAETSNQTPPLRNSAWASDQPADREAAPDRSWTVPPLSLNDRTQPPTSSAPDIVRLPPTSSTDDRQSPAHRAAVIDTTQEERFFVRPAPRPTMPPRPVAPAPTRPATNPRPTAPTPLPPTTEGAPPTDQPASPAITPAPPITFTDEPPAAPRATTPIQQRPPHTGQRPVRQMPSRNRNAIHAAVRLAEEVVEHGSALVTRNAYFSAKQEFLQALQMIAEGLDVRAGDTTHTKKLAAGFQALREAEDFVPTEGATWQRPEDLANIVDAHQTPVLSDASGEVTPWMARQQYYQFAHQQISGAVAGQPAASRALFCLGKLHMELAKQHDVRIVESGPKAMVFHQAALTVDPQNHPAANELGVLLARFSQFEDARKVLLHGLSISERAEMWHNLSVVHVNLNEMELARRAAHECRLAKQRRGRTPSQSPRSDTVQWVDAHEFARMSPHPNAGTPHQPHVPQPEIQSAKQWWNFWK